MLHHIAMEGIGPASSMRIDLGPRLNLIAGDNGLGKTFLLDIAWWAITQTWAGEVIRPSRSSPKGGPARRPRPFELDVAVTDERGNLWPLNPQFDSIRQQWQIARRRLPSPGIMLYGRVDGGFGVWDALRNDPFGVDESGRSLSFLFRSEQVWNGLTGPEKNVVCLGLLQDWISWQNTNDPAFGQLNAALHELSPPEGPRLVPGKPTRVSLADVRVVPTLKQPYGDVPITLASAGMKRIVALAYLLVWAVREHLQAAAFLGMEPHPSIVVLIDEIEAHLHPKWQRAILRALLATTQALAGNARVQIIVTTHSPFVPLSVETLVNENDRLWDLDLVDDDVKLSLRPWEVRGDATAWATSNLFDLKSVRSREGEAAIHALEAVTKRATVDPTSVTDEEIAAVDGMLAKAMSALDPIYARWHAFKRTRTAAARP
jgi:hypothetical protein